MANNGIGGLVTAPRGAPVLPGYTAPQVGPVISPPDVDYETIKSNMPEWQRIHLDRIYNTEGGGQNLPPRPVPTPARAPYRDGLSSIGQGRLDFERDVPKSWYEENVYAGNVPELGYDSSDTPDFTKYRDRYADGGVIQPPLSEAQSLAGAVDGMGSQNPGGFSDNDMNEIVASVQGAILNPGPDAEEVINNFIAIFGEEEFERLKAMILLGQDESDGLSDSVPAMVDGQQPAALSEGEFVVPSDVVSGIGNGSTEAGARRLDDIVGQVRTQKTGSPAQPVAMSGIRGLM